MSEVATTLAGEEPILLERGDDGIAVLTLNRPRVKNAVTIPMWETLRRTLQDVARSGSDRVLVLTGAGGDFCSGADLADASPEQSDSFIATMRQVGDAVLALANLPIPSIAKVKGDAVGGGMNLALGCDLIVAAESARFAEVFARRALSLDCGGSWLLPRLVGVHKAKELALFGDLITARDAQAIGFVNRVVPDADLDAFVDDWARRLAGGAPLALQHTKRMLSNALTQTLSEALDAEATAQALNFTSEDAREGMRAFLEKRAPVFRGR